MLYDLGEDPASLCRCVKPSEAEHERLQVHSAGSEVRTGRCSSICSAAGRSERGLAALGCFQHADWKGIVGVCCLQANSHLRFVQEGGGLGCSQRDVWSVSSEAACVKQADCHSVVFMQLVTHLKCICGLTHNRSLVSLICLWSF